MITGTCIGIGLLVVALGALAALAAGNGSDDHHRSSGSPN